jgi:hypothetical protein
MIMASGSMLQMAFSDQTWGSTISFANMVSMPALGGTLEFTFEEGIDPELMGITTFKLFNWPIGMTAEDRFASIDTGGLNWDISHLYDTGEVTLLPEPTALSLLALGGLAMIRRVPWSRRLRPRM